MFFFGEKNRGKLVGLGARERSIEVILIFRNVHIGEQKEAPQRTCGSPFNMEKSPNYGVCFMFKSNMDSSRVEDLLAYAEIDQK